MAKKARIIDADWLSDNMPLLKPELENNNLLKPQGEVAEIEFLKWFICITAKIILSTMDDKNGKKSLGCALYKLNVAQKYDPSRVGNYEAEELHFGCINSIEDLESFFKRYLSIIYVCSFEEFKNLVSILIRGLSESLEKIAHQIDKELISKLINLVNFLQNWLQTIQTKGILALAPNVSSDYGNFKQYSLDENFKGVGDELKRLASLLGGSGQFKKLRQVLMKYFQIKGRKSRTGGFFTGQDLKLNDKVLSSDDVRAQMEKMLNDKEILQQQKAYIFYLLNNVLRQKAAELVGLPGKSASTVTRSETKDGFYKKLLIGLGINIEPY